MNGPGVECPTCRAPADRPCTLPDGQPCAGVHTERVLAAVKAMFGAFTPPVPADRAASAALAITLAAPEADRPLVAALAWRESRFVTWPDPLPASMFGVLGAMALVAAVERLMRGPR